MRRNKHGHPERKRGTSHRTMTLRCDHYVIQAANARAFTSFKMTRDQRSHARRNFEVEREKMTTVIPTRARDLAQTAKSVLSSCDHRNGNAISFTSFRMTRSRRRYARGSVETNFRFQISDFRLCSRLRAVRFQSTIYNLQSAIS